MHQERSSAWGINVMWSLILFNSGNKSERSGIQQEFLKKVKKIANGYSRIQDFMEIDLYFFYTITFLYSKENGCHNNIPRLHLFS